MRHAHPHTPNDASGFVTDSFADLGASFSEITVIYSSERNFVAKAKRYGRWWVLKGVVDENDSSSLRASLRKEFEVMMLLGNDAKPRAYALEDVPGMGRCIVMDFVAGSTLEQWLAEPHTRAERSLMARRLSLALGRVHASGVVHRDVKPSNIMVSELTGEPVLVDYGLADTLEHTHLKQPAGTRSYMSAEQEVMTRPDVRNDLYSLGRVLSQMNLPIAWRRAVKRCLKPMKSRPGSVADMLAMVDRSRATMRWGAVMAAAVGLVAVSLVAFRTPSGSAGLPDSRIEAVVQQAQWAHRRADSLQNALDSLLTPLASAAPLAQEQMPKALPDEVPSVVAETRTDKSAAVDRIIAEGCRRIDKEWQATAMHYLDTVSSPLQPGADWSVERLRIVKIEYIKEVWQQLTPEQLSVLEQKLTDRIDENYNKWTQKKLSKLSVD